MRRVNSSWLRVGAKSHPGTRRSNNEDCMTGFKSPLGEVFLVADGMGGHEGGEIAAEVTKRGFETHLRNAAPGASPAEAIRLAAARTNQEIYAKARSGEVHTKGMGSTVVLALVSGAQLIVAHAGDSRAYLFRDRHLSPLTRDHTSLQRMIDAGMLDGLSEEELRSHPDGSVLTRALGKEPTLDIEISTPLALRPDDVVVLCSDGLSGYVSGGIIERTLDQGRDAQALTDALIDAALQAGGEDNVTVQVLTFRPPAGVSLPATVPPSESGTSARLAAILPVAAAFVLGVALASAAFTGYRSWLTGGTTHPTPAPTKHVKPTATPTRMATPPVTRPPHEESPSEEASPSTNKEPPPVEESTPVSPPAQTKPRECDGLNVAFLGNLEDAASTSDLGEEANALLKRLKPRQIVPGDDVAPDTLGTLRHKVHYRGRWGRDCAQALAKALQYKSDDTSELPEPLRQQLGSTLHLIVVP